MTALAVLLAVLLAEVSPNLPPAGAAAPEVGGGAIFGGLLILAAGLASLTYWGARLTRWINQTFPTWGLGDSVPLEAANESLTDGSRAALARTDEPAGNATERTLRSARVPEDRFVPFAPVAEPPAPVTAEGSAPGSPTDVPAPAPVPPTALLLAGCWIGIVLLLKSVAAMAAPQDLASPPDLTAHQIAVRLVMELGLQLLVYLVLLTAVVSGPAGPPWQRGSVRRSLWAGLTGFVAAVGPVLLIMLVMKGQRTDETEHQFLRLLRDADSSTVIGLICLSAAVVAPLSEELTYRVTLIGGLESFLGRWGALVGSSVLFAAVHGFPDSVALLPLAFVLGSIYQRTRSYLAVVTTHAAFNAFNLAIVLLQTWLT